MTSSLLLLCLLLALLFVALQLVIAAIAWGERKLEERERSACDRAEESESRGERGWW